MRLYTLKELKGTIQEFVAVENKNGNFIRVMDLGMDYRTMNDLIENITEEELCRLKAYAQGQNNLNTVSEIDKNEIGKTIKLCAPIPIPRQDIVCLGVNYREHIEETKEILDFTKKPATVYFSKRVNEAIGDGDRIPNYDFVDSLDYEVELGVVLSKDAKHIKKEDASAYIFGYTIINDISARNVQLKHQQWYLGKSLDGYTAMGPCIVTTDEITDVQNLEISCRVNGEKRQNSNTAYMIQTIAGALEELTEGMTLKKGTVIATGTPGGVAMGMNPPKYLKSGDQVECYIEQVGSIKNMIE